MFNVIIVSFARYSAVTESRCQLFLNLVKELESILNKTIVSTLHICYLPGWRSLVLSMVYADRGSPVNNVSSYLFIYLSIYLFIHWFIYLFIFLNVFFLKWEKR